jgi:L,D-transpeptidase catalytic domain
LRRRAAPAAPLRSLVRRAATLALVAALVAAVLQAREPEPMPRSLGTHAGVMTLPAPPKPAFRVGAPLPPRHGEHEFRWTPVRRSVAARAHPDPAARVLERIDTRTPEGTTNIVLALDRRTGADGRLWVRVRLAILPNGSTGWVPRAALGGYGTVRTRLVVDRGRLSATLLRDERPILKAPIGIGAAGSPTPAGEFYVRNRLTRYRSPFYGPVAFGTSARSPTLTDWPDGGFVGIHGTDRPDLLPGRVSHGCIRMRNPDILRLARLMPPGTPITIR